MPVSTVTDCMLLVEVELRQAERHRSSEVAVRPELSFAAVVDSLLLVNMDSEARMGWMVAKMTVVHTDFLIALEQRGHGVLEAASPPERKGSIEVGIHR